MNSLNYRKLGRIVFYTIVLVFLGILGGLMVLGFMGKLQRDFEPAVSQALQGTKKEIKKELARPRIAGATNPDITQATIGKTICNPKWSTKSIRPSSYYTNKIKLRQIKEYGYKDTDISHYEEDHFINLGIGGSPKSENNLWPQPLAEAYLKDRLEVELQRKVCRKEITLKQAQEMIKQFYIFDLNDNKLGAVEELVQ